MHTFKIKPGGFTEIRKQMLMRTIPIMLIAAAAGLIIGSVNEKKQDGDVNVLPFVIPLVAVSLGIGLYRGLNRQKALFDSYTLTITNNLITREQLNTPTISIYFSEIIEINKPKNGGFLIKGKDATDKILVPPQIDNYAQLEAILQGIQPVATQEKTSFLQKYQSLSAVIAVGLMLCVYTVSNKIVVALTGTVLIVLMIWSFINLRSNKNIDNKTRNAGWWMLLVLASVIGVMILKLTGMMDMQSR